MKEEKDVYHLLNMKDESENYHSWNLKDEKYLACNVEPDDHKTFYESLVFRLKDISWSDYPKVKGE